ncbi:hypothetical protein GCM10007086_28380 [Photobacterium aphoticum]|nr:hypothetical protein GCM10007086_28380 [Photobacterium aphoticum]
MCVVYRNLINACNFQCISGLHDDILRAESFIIDRCPQRVTTIEYDNALYAKGLPNRHIDVADVRDASCFVMGYDFARIGREGGNVPN